MNLESLKNKEQFEATQAEIDQVNKAEFEKLSEEERNKILAVEKAVKILVDAGVPCSLFPFLKFRKNKKEQCVLYSTLSKVVPFWDENDRLIENAEENISDYHCSMITCLFMNPYMAWGETKDPSQRFQHFAACVWAALRKESERCSSL